jgi:hypothetical protein
MEQEISKLIEILEDLIQKNSRLIKMKIAKKHVDVLKQQIKVAEDLQ